MVNKFSHMRFEPSGFTKNPEIPIAKSLMDYVFRWLASRFLDLEDQAAIGIIHREVEPSPEPEPKPVANGNGKTNGNGNGHAELKVIAKGELTFVNTADAPICADCGSTTVRSGACYKCMNCGSTTGCS